MACNCKMCQGKVVNLLHFEEHSGSSERFMTSNMILSKYNLSLKVLPSPSIIPNTLSFELLARPLVMHESHVR